MNYVRRILSLALVSLACLASQNAFAQGSPAIRAAVLVEAHKLIGTKEATGRNDGAAIDRILASVGLAGSKAPWCAAANRYIYDSAGIRKIGPRSAWSPDWVRSPTWTRAKGGATPLPGDAWGIWFKNLGRIAHTGLVECWGAIVLTLEGNTSPDAIAGSDADRDGGGFYRKRRLRSQIHSVRNWIDG